MAGVLINRIEELGRAFIFEGSSKMRQVNQSCSKTGRAGPVAAVGVILVLVFLCLGGSSGKPADTSFDSRALRRDLSTGAVAPQLGVPSCAVRKELFDAKDLGRSFLEIGIALNSDKVPSPGFSWWIPHKYHGIYSLYLTPLRTTPMRLLEIGLGCGMPNGAGKSIPLWRSFLPCTELKMLEFDGKCAEGFRDQLEGLYIGDQGSVSKLQEALQGGPYDIVMDDGSHNVNHQIVSLRELFPRMQPGGLYFVEDIATSFEVPWPGTRTAHDFIAAVIAVLHTRDLRSPVFADRTAEIGTSWADVKYISSLVVHVDCGTGICVLVRNDVPAANPPEW